MGARVSGVPPIPEGWEPVPDLPPLPEGFELIPEAGAGGPEGIGRQALRKAELVSRGLTDKAIDLIGAVPDTVADGLRAVGIETSRPNFYRDNLKAGWEAAGRFISKPLNDAVPGVMEGEMSTADKLAYGAGSGLGDAASVAVPAAGVANVAKAGSVTQRAASALTAQPVLQATAGAAGGAVGEATDSPALGTAAALAVPLAGAATKRAITPVQSRPTHEQARLIETAKREGIELTPGQQTQSRPLQTLESTFESLPFTAGPQREIIQNQRQQFNRAALARTGTSADAATPEVLEAADARLGQEFNRLTRKTTLIADDQMLDDMQRVVDDYSKTLPSQQREVFHNYVKDILDNGDVMDGARYQRARSALTKQSHAIANTDPQLSRALGGLRDTLDDAAGRAIPPELQSEWQLARREYGNLQAITRAVGSGTPDAVSGNVPPAQLTASLRAGNDRKKFAMGEGDLNDVARVGQAFVRPQIPNSATSERAIMAGMLSGGMGTGGAAGLAAGGDLLTSAGMGLAGAATATGLPRLIQALYNSPEFRAYITNKMAAEKGPTVTKELLAAMLAGQGRHVALPQD